MDKFPLIAIKRLPDERDRTVAVIAGGAGNHEVKVGFLGAGMLSASVWREFQTPPSVDAIVVAIRAVTGKAGALLTMPDDPADLANFDMAWKLARAEGFLIATVTLRDRSLGLGGAEFVHKIAGAAAAEGKSIQEMRLAAEAAQENLAASGLAVTEVVSPVTAKIWFAQDDVEESGTKLFMSADELVDSLIPHLDLKAGDRVVGLLNDGGCYLNHLSLIGRRTLVEMDRRDFLPERFYAGEFASSGTSRSISICLMRVDHDRLRWFNAQTTALAWSSTESAGPGPLNALQRYASDKVLPQIHEFTTQQGQKFRAALISGCVALMSDQEEYPELGDAASAILCTIQGRLPLDRPHQVLPMLAVALHELLSGAEGVLYSVLFSRTGNALAVGSEWPVAILYGAQFASELSGLRAGDGGTLDAIMPFAKKLYSGATLEESLAEAEKGAAQTAHPFAQGAMLWLRAACASIR